MDYDVWRMNNLFPRAYRPWMKGEPDDVTVK
jgi:hypothetical protein